MAPTPETLKSKILNVWIPALTGLLVFLVSLYWDLSPGFGYFEGTSERIYWLQRAGAVLTIMGALIAFHESRESIKYENGRLFINAELPYKWISVIYVILGTFIWGYGDMPFRVVFL